MRVLQNICAVLLTLLPQVQLAQSPSNSTTAGREPAPARWKSSVEMTIGGADADEHAVFGRLSGLAIDRTGRVFIADAQDNHITVFTRDGAYVSTIGRTGAGPLEFKHLVSIGFGPDQLLWARDEGNGRFLAMDVSATPTRVAKNIPLQNFFSSGDNRPIVFDPNGLMVEEGIWFDKATDAFRPLRLRRSLAGTVAYTDTLQVPAGAYAGLQKVSRVQRDASGKEIGLSQSTLLQPHGPLWLRAYGPNGARAEIVTSRYEVSIYDANGKLVRIIKRTVPPVTLSATEKVRADSLLSAAKQSLSFGVPTAKAPVIGLKFTQEGDLWVERAVPDGHAREADIFDNAGKFIAVAEWPRNTEITRDYRSVITQTSVYAIATDSNDLETVVRLKFR